MALARLLDSLIYIHGGWDAWSLNKNSNVGHVVYFVWAWFEILDLKFAMKRPLSVKWSYDLYVVQALIHWNMFLWLNCEVMIVLARICDAWSFYYQLLVWRINAWNEIVTTHCIMDWLKWLFYFVCATTSFGQLIMWFISISCVFHLWYHWYLFLEPKWQCTYMYFLTMLPQLSDAWSMFFSLQQKW